MRLIDVSTYFWIRRALRLLFISRSFGTTREHVLARRRLQESGDDDEQQLGSPTNLPPAPPLSSPEKNDCDEDMDEDDDDDDDPYDFGETHLNAHIAFTVV